MEYGQDNGNLVLAETWREDLPSEYEYWATNATAPASDYPADQQPDTGFAGGNPIWQSFVSSRTGWLEAIELSLSPIASGRPVAMLRLYEGEGTSGHLLVEQQVTVHAVGGGAFQRFPIRAALTSGMKYTFELPGNAGSPQPTVNVVWDKASKYPAGTCSIPGTAVAFKTWVRASPPEWSHPVG